MWASDVEVGVKYLASLSVCSIIGKNGTTIVSKGKTTFVVFPTPLEILGVNGQGRGPNNREE